MLTSCIIVEDEPLAAERMKDFVSKLPSLKLVSAFNNGIDALLFLKTNKVDLIFLDINLGEISGIELLEAASVRSQVVFTTAYPDYAIKGFDLNIADYLLKPYTFQRFLQAVEKVQLNLSKKLNNADKPFIFVKTEFRLEKILLNDVLYIEGRRDYRKIHTSTKKIMTLQKFREFEQVLPSSLICRVHKSFMVSLNKIDSVERYSIRINDKWIPISQTYKKNFFEQISHPKKVFRKE